MIPNPLFDERLKTGTGGIFGPYGAAFRGMGMSRYASIYLLL